MQARTGASSNYLSAKATILATTRTLWGQNFNGSANVTGSLTSVGDITGGASSMTITAGTGNSRTMIFKTTTSGGTATQALYMDATQRVGIGTTTTLATQLQLGTKVADDNSYSYDTGAAMFVHQTATATATLNDPKAILYLARQGTSGQAYGAAAQFAIYRYENSSTNSRTGLDISLAHGSFDVASNIVMSLRSDKSVTFGGAVNGTGAWTITGGAGNMTIVAGTGNSRTMTLQYTNSSGVATNGIFIDSTGKVGIGRTPTVQLEINGTFLAYGDMQAAGTFRSFDATVRYRMDVSLATNVGNIVAYDNTGSTYIPIYQDASSHNWRVATTGGLTTALTISSAGNTTVAGTLAVQGGSITGGAGNMTIVAGTGNSRTLSLQSTTSGGTATTAAIIDATQRILLGTNTFTKSGGGIGDLYLDNGGNDSPGILFYRKNNDNFAIDAEGADTAEKLRFVRKMNETGGTVMGYFDAGGNFNLTNSAPQINLDAGSGYIATLRRTAGAGGNFHIDSTGGGGIYLDWYGGAAVHVGNGAAAYGTINAAAFTVGSSRVLKQNIVDSVYGLKDIVGLQAKSFQYISEPTKDCVGLIAEDVQVVIPEAVQVMDRAGDPILGINYNTLIPILINSIKELNDRIAILEGSKLSSLI